MSARSALAALFVSAGCAPSEAPPSKPPPIAARSHADAPAPAPVATAPPGEAPATAPPPLDPGRANLDPDDDQVVGPPEAIADCDARLTAAGVRFRAGSLPVKATAGGTCGAPQAVIYEAGPSGLAWNAAPVVTCSLALGLARFEGVLQAEAEKHLGARVVRIRQGGTYSCRRMARFRLASEHSYGNAIDLHAFELSDHRWISVKSHFGDPSGEPEAPESRFLRSVARRAFAEDVFSVVLTPFWDKLHADHFHLDQARYRVGAVGPASGR